MTAISYAVMSDSVSWKLSPVILLRVRQSHSSGINTIIFMCCLFISFMYYALTNDVDDAMVYENYFQGLLLYFPGRKKLRSLKYVWSPLELRASLVAERLLLTNMCGTLLHAKSWAVDKNKTQTFPSTFTITTCHRTGHRIFWNNIRIYFITAKAKLVVCVFIEHYVKQNTFWSREDHSSKMSYTQYSGEHISDLCAYMD
jgi:hypothetical protein